MSAVVQPRTPELRWMLAAAAIALCVHGLCWFLLRRLMGDADALIETQRQMWLALGWMVCTLILWKMSAPASRLHAVMSGLMCSLFLAVLGSIAAFLKLVLIEQAVVDDKLISSFLTLGGLLVAAQVVLSLPEAIVLQAVALKRA